MVNQERCEQLREALSDARSRMSPPMRDRAMHGAEGVVTAGPSTTEPQASPDLEDEIRRLEQALRDEGCEPE